MKINLALWDRVFRLIFGVPLMIWSIAGGPFWGYFGVYLIMSASWGFCPIYAWLKIRTVVVEDRRFVSAEDDLNI